MAILKQLKVPSGVVVDYTRISKAEIFPQAKFVQITVDLYLSEAERAAGAPLVYQERIQVPFTMFSENLMGMMYDALVSYEQSPLVGGIASQDVDAETPSSLAPNPTPEPSAEAPNNVETTPISPSAGETA